MSNECNSSRRPHLTKDERVPKCYKEAAKILELVKSCQGNLKTVMYKSRLRGNVFNKVYALCLNVLRHRPFLDKAMKETNLLEKESFLRKELTGIMIYDLIFGKGLPGDSKPVVAIRKYHEAIEKLYRSSLQDDSLTVADICTIPKYVRVNTLVTSVSDILKDLQDWDYQELKVEANATFEEYLDIARNLKTGQFLVDYHFKDLLVFSSDENLCSWPLYRQHHVFIQDKSSYIPVHVLDPTPDSTVLDACAAPGMKTAHVAAKMKNSGKIYAFEKNGTRFEVLQDMLKSAAVKICTSECKDFSSVNSGNFKFASVEYVLVDPSCSGSGMVNRMDDVTDTEESKNSLRIQKLAGFQIMLLKHALTFCNVKRVVYSTCSITEEENEFVIHEVLNHFQNEFKLVPVMPEWPIRGSENYEFGKLCLRAYPEKSLTNGFFVAMFERLTSEEQNRNSNFEPEHLPNYSNNLGSTKSKRRRKFESVKEEQLCEISNVSSENSVCSSRKAKKAKLEQQELEEQQCISSYASNECSSSYQLKTSQSKKSGRKSEQDKYENLNEGEKKCKSFSLLPQNSYSDSHSSRKMKNNIEPEVEEKHQSEIASITEEKSFYDSDVPKKKKSKKKKKSEHKEEAEYFKTSSSIPEIFNSDSHTSKKMKCKNRVSEPAIDEQQYEILNSTHEKLFHDHNASEKKSKMLKNKYPAEEEKQLQNKTSNFIFETSFSDTCNPKKSKKSKKKIGTVITEENNIYDENFSSEKEPQNSYPNSHTSQKMKNSIEPETEEKHQSGIASLTDEKSFYDSDVPKKKKSKKKKKSEHKEEAEYFKTSSSIPETFYSDSHTSKKMKCKNRISEPAIDGQQNEVYSTHEQIFHDHNASEKKSKISKKKSPDEEEQQLQDKTSNFIFETSFSDTCNHKKLKHKKKRQTESKEEKQPEENFRSENLSSNFHASEKILKFELQEKEFEENGASEPNSEENTSRKKKHKHKTLQIAENDVPSSELSCCMPVDKVKRNKTKNEKRSCSESIELIEHNIKPYETIKSIRNRIQTLKLQTKASSNHF